MSAPCDTGKPPDLQFHVPGPYNLAKLGLVLAVWVLLVGWFAVIFWQSKTQWNYSPDSQRTDKSDLNRGDQCENLNATQTGPNTWSGTVLEPENTWSNAAYLLAGFLILAATKLPLGYLMGAQLVVLALLSAYYHCTLMGNAQTLDVGGIYIVLWALVVYGIHSVIHNHLSKREPQFWLWRFLRNPWTVAVVLAVFTTWAGFEMAAHRDDHYLFRSNTVSFTMVTAIIVLASFQMGRHRFEPGWDYFKFWRMFSWTEQPTAENLRTYFLGFLFIGGISLVCRFGDGDNNWLCYPHSPIQAHAIWHLFGAYTLLLGYDLFAWSAIMDYPVLARTWPSQEDACRVTARMVYATSLTSIILGLGLLGLTFVPKAFVDDPPKGQSAAAPHLTGILIATFFILVGVVLLILRLTGVIPDRDAAAGDQTCPTV